MDDGIPLAEDFSKYSDILLNDDTFSQKANHQSNITTFTSKVSKSKTTSKVKKHRTKPCVNCRKRKTKCATLPNQKKCIECTKRNLECVHDTQSVVGTYNNGSKQNERNSSPCCDNCYHRRTRCIIQEGLDVCSECLASELPCKFSEQTNVTIRNDTPVLDYDEYNGPTILRKTLSLQGPKSSQIQSPNSILEKNLLKFGNHEDGDTAIEEYLSPNSNYLKNEQLIINQSLKLRKINNNSFFKIVNDNEQFIKLNHRQVDEVERIVYPHGFTLIKLYLKHVHPLLPVIQADVFSEKYARSHKEFEPLLLTMVFLHGLKLWNQSNLPIEEKPDVDKLERLCKVLYSECLVNLHPKISTCQALILLINYNPTSNDLKPITNIKTKDDKWEKLSILILMIEELGLNHNSEEMFTIPDWERKLRKLLAWSIIMFDKFQSLLEFKASKINPNNWILNELSSKDFLTETLDGDLGTSSTLTELKTEDKELAVLGNLIFVKMVHLSYHVNDSLNEIFNLKSMKFDDFDTLIAKSITLLNNLNDWYDSLPSHLKSLQMHSTYISTGSLNLSYHLVNSLIYRRIINNFIDNYGDFIAIDEVLIKFKFIFKRIVKDLKRLDNEFMEKLTVDHLNDCFWYGFKSNGFINIAIVIQLLLKITKLELYIDDEYAVDELEELNKNYIRKLTTLADAGDKDTADVLRHIDAFIHE